MGHKRPLPSFETPRKRAAPQDDGDAFRRIVIARSTCDEAIQPSLVALDCFAEPGIGRAFA
jgi:hypothetical protein